MRRVLVIVLILLFPLNVFALSMSASLLQASVASEPAAASIVIVADIQPSGEFSCELACDLDPDEPPGHQDLHDIVNHEAAVRWTGPPIRADLRDDAYRRCHSTPPPVKPPRA
jgi:hypothetical protein